MSLESQVEIAQRRMGNLSIFTTLRILEPQITDRHGVFRDDSRPPISPTFLGSCIAVGIIAGRKEEKDGTFSPTIRLMAMYNLGTDTLAVCGEIRPAGEWRRKDVRELLYKTACLD